MARRHTLLVAAVLEAARILKSLGVKPRRTIRFAFFSGEEQACLGSRAYVAAHEDELDRLKTVLIMDEGAQAPLGFQLHGRADLEANARRTLASLTLLGADNVSLDATFDEDHAPFLVVGVPPLRCVSNRVNTTYTTTHQRTRSTRSMRDCWRWTRP